MPKRRPSHSSPPRYPQSQQINPDQLLVPGDLSQPLEAQSPTEAPDLLTSRAESDLAIRALAELARRRAEALELYEPTPGQDAFHSSQAYIRLCRGSNRAGKTFATLVEVARAVTGRDPHGKWPKRDGRFLIVAKDEREMGQVIYRKLFRANGFHNFRIKRDENGLWRALKPGEDTEGSKTAPPLIPQRYVESISWKNKKSSVPSVVKLRNGWEMIFAASGGKPVHGVDLDGVLFDEEIIDAEWFPESMARLLDRKGRFLWSATPQAGTEHLYALHQRAEAKEEGVEEFFLSLADNPYMEEKEKKKLASNYSDDEYRVRILGEYAASGYLVYPEFRMDIHGVDPFDIPGEWCRYLVVDPGRQVCAVLFAAVPPDDKHVYLYDELYLKRCSAAVFGEMVAKRVGDHAFEAFIIDHHGGAITDIGSGKNVEAQYSAELSDRHVSCARTGSHFTWGCDDPKGNVEAVRGWLRIRSGGQPYLKVVKGLCANLEWEAKYYHYKRGRDGILTDEPVRKHDHLMACLGYLAGYDPQYVRPARRGLPKSDILRALESRRKLRGESASRSFMRLGPKGR